MKRLTTSRLVVAGIAVALIVFGVFIYRDTDGFDGSASSTLKQDWDYARMYVAPNSAYERSMRPNVHAGHARLHDLVTVSPPEALGFYQSTANALPTYHPQYQAFVPVSGPRAPPSIVPSIGPSDWVRVGFVQHDDVRLPLFGRPVIPGGNRFDYYVLDDGPHSIPLGLNDHNGLELETGNRVSVQGYHGRFFVHIY